MRFNTKYVKIKEIGTIIETLFAKRQSLKQILLSHLEIEVSLKTLYTHVESSIFKDLVFDIYSISLRRQVANSVNTYTSIAERYNLSVTKIQRFFDKSVNIKRKTLPEALSIDEHYFPASNFDSLYICILMDFKTSVIVDVLPDRKKAYISQYLNNIRNATHNKSELDNVKYISIDLYENYRDLSHIIFPMQKCVQTASMCSSI